MSDVTPNHAAAERLAAERRAAADARLADDLSDAGGAPHRPADDTEQVYFDGNPLLRGEIGTGLLWIIAGLAVIALPLTWGFWRQGRGDIHPWWPWWLILGLVVVGLVLILIPIMRAKTIHYRISNYRIDFERGMFSKTIDTLELWHVEDLKFHQSFLARLIGVGTITVLSHDDTTPELRLRALPNPRPLFDTLKQRIIAVKRQRGVIKMDVGN